MFISSMYTCFWCVDLAFNIWTVQINIVVLCVILDAKQIIPNACWEYIKMK